MIEFTPPVDAVDVLTYKNVRVYIAQNSEQYRVHMRPTFYAYGMDARGRIVRLGLSGAAGSGSLFVEPGQALVAIKKAIDEYSSKYDYPYFPYRGFDVKLVKWPGSPRLAIASGFDIELSLEVPDRATDVAALNLLRDKIDRYISYGLTAEKQVKLAPTKILDLTPMGGPQHDMGTNPVVNDLVDYALGQAELKVAPSMVMVESSGVQDIMDQAAEAMREAGLDPDVPDIYLGLTSEQIEERKELLRHQEALEAAPQEFEIDEV